MAGFRTHHWVNADANNISEIGVYYGGQGSFTHTPASDGYIIVFSLNENLWSGVQMFITISNKVYIRTSWNGYWNSWVALN